MSDASVIATALLTVAGWSAILTTDFDRPPALVDVRERASATADVPPQRTGTLRPEFGSDGRLYLDATVNDTQVRFLLDTAATHSVISRHDATRLGVSIGAETRLNTVGGVIVAHRGIARTMSVGDSSVRASTILVVPDLANPLLGMDTIRALESERIEFSAGNSGGLLDRLDTR